MVFNLKVETDWPIAFHSLLFKCRRSTYYNNDKKCTIVSAWASNCDLPLPDFCHYPWLWVVLCTSSGPAGLFTGRSHGAWGMQFCNSVVFISAGRWLHLIYCCLSCCLHSLPAEAAGQGSLGIPPLLQLPPHRETNVVLTKSLSLYFTNEDLGARCWSKNLLAQRGRESTWVTFLICSRRRPSPSLSENKTPPTRCSSLLLLVPLFLQPLTSAHTLWLLPINWLLALPLNLWLILFNAILGFTLWSNIPQHNWNEVTGHGNSSVPL